MRCDYRECDASVDPGPKGTRRFCDNNLCRNRENRLRRKEGRDLERPVTQAQEGAEHTPRRPSAPRGGEPGVRWEGGQAEGVTVPMAEVDPDEEEILQAMGLDAERWAIEPGSLRVSTWQQREHGDWLYSYRARLLSRGEAEADRADVEACLAEIADWKPEPHMPCGDGDDAFVVCLSDWQIGKGEGGGTPETVERILRMIDAVEARIRELRDGGRPLGALYVLTLGDLVEGCDGHYPMQTHTADRDRRSQVKIVRRLIRDAVRRWAPLFDRTVVAGVAGNHGENRREGKAFTTFADNDDVAVLEQVADVFAEHQSEVLRRVSFVVPEDRLALTLDVAGVPVGIVHGHQFTRGGTMPQAKAVEWWRGQTFGLRSGLQDARILVSAHFHHFSAIEHASEDDGPGRWHFQTPAMDGGSQWWADVTGGSSAAATLTFRVADGGWTDLHLVQ